MTSPRLIRRAVGLGAMLFVLAPGPRVALAQGTAASEIEALKREIRQLQERLNRIEQSQTTVAPVAPPRAAQTPPPATPAVPAPPPVAGEREISLGREHPLEVIGLAKPEVAGVRISGFFVGSANFNSHIQMVPEFAGNAPVSSDPKRTDFRFDQFTIGAFKQFAPWLSAGASIEFERHGHRHSHGQTPFGCPNSGLACREQFGAEAIETEVSLHRFNITGVAPIGNGLSLSFGRFDTPYGIERHDAPLNLTATTSEVTSFGRPMSMTGFQAAYQFAPWLDATAWIANRWESETTEDTLEDNNSDKSFGGRLGFTPFSGQSMLNFGIGGWWGPERANDTRYDRWIVDADLTWSPLPGLLLAAEAVYGGESGLNFRRRGVPIAEPVRINYDARWFGLYGLAHYDPVNWLGLTFRYGYFDDWGGARTGVSQALHSFTFAPILHLSRLIPDLRPIGLAYPRTRHLMDWVDLRLEYRLNHSNKPVFANVLPPTPIVNSSEDSHQLTLQFIVNY